MKNLKRKGSIFFIRQVLYEKSKTDFSWTNGKRQRPLPKGKLGGADDVL